MFAAIFIGSDDIMQFYQLKEGTKGRATYRKVQGPYLIRCCLGIGVHELETKDGKVLKKKYNML